MPKIDAQLGIRVTKDLKTRLTAQAKSEMKSVSTLVVEVVEAYLDSKGWENSSKQPPGADSLRRAVGFANSGARYPRCIAGWCGRRRSSRISRC